MQEILSLLGTLVVVVAVLALAYWVTRLIGQKSSGIPGSGSGNLRILEQLVVGKDQRLLVAQVGERVLLLGVSPAQVTLVTELSADEAALWTDLPPGGQPPGFRDSLIAALHRKTNSQ